MTVESSVRSVADMGDYPAPMRREDWAARLTDTIAREVVRYRKQRGMTAQQLVDECGELGLPMKRTVLVNLETGRRGNVTVSELVVLAAALRVTPLQLIFPVGHDDSVELLPEQQMPTWEALKWFTAEHPALPGEIIEGEDWATGGAVLAMYRTHERHVNDLRVATTRAADMQRRAGGEGLSDGERAQLLADADFLTREAFGAAGNVKTTREIMRRHGWAPLPSLPSELMYLEQGEGES